MSCPHCTDGPGDFVLMMFASHIMSRLRIEDYTIDLTDETLGRVYVILRDYLEPAASICRWDLLVESVTIKDGVITTKPDLSNVVEGFELDPMLEEQLVPVRLPDRVLSALAALSGGS